MVTAGRASPGVAAGARGEKEEAGADKGTGDEKGRAGLGVAGEAGKARRTGMDGAEARGEGRRT